MNTDTSLLKGTKRSQLFDSSSGEDSDSDDSDDEEDKARFNIKQQFEGTAGRKVTPHYYLEDNNSLNQIGND